MNMTLRIAGSADRDDIHAVHLAAFPESESALVAKLAVDLLAEDTTPQTFSWVAEADGRIIGHVAFSPVTMDSDEPGQGYILAPLGVRPEHHKGGVGSKLVEAGLKHLSDRGVDFVIVYGDPAYYGRFGFSAEAAARFTPPYPLQYPFGWQGLALGEAPSGDTPVRIGCVGSLSDPQLW